jgi:putative ABC transport system permease protein
VYIFESNNVWITLAVIAMMIIASSWIGLRTLKKLRVQLFGHSIIASVLGGGAVLLIVVWPVLTLEPLYKPQFTIPLAGMIFANSMNTISLALERLDSEMRNGSQFIQARNTAMHTAMIPIINSMFAVGLVSLPGMMTGQVLAGVSPLIAVRYQIVVMCMIFASAVFSTAILLILGKNTLVNYADKK